MTEFQKKYRGLLGDGEDGYIDYDGIQSLIQENENLKAELKEEKENFALFRDKVAVPALQHAHKQLNEREDDDPTIVWVVDLMHEEDYRMQNAEFFYTEEEARRFVDAIPELNLSWVTTSCYEIKKSKMNKSAFDALVAMKVAASLDE